MLLINYILNTWWVDNILDAISVHNSVDGGDSATYPISEMKEFQVYNILSIMLAF